MEFAIFEKGKEYIFLFFPLSPLVTYVYGEWV